MIIKLLIIIIIVVIYFDKFKFYNLFAIPVSITKVITSNYEVINLNMIIKHIQILLKLIRTIISNTIKRKIYITLSIFFILYKKMGISCETTK